MLSKALHQTEISELFVFTSFGKVCFSKFGNFSEITGFSNLQKFHEKSLKKSQEIISFFWVKKNLFLGQKVWKTFGNRGFQTFGIYGNLEFVLFRTFRKLRKNEVKLELQKLQKTCANSKSDLNVWFKVRNAGPYCFPRKKCSIKNAF